eukprot:1991004-Lingulodinium_polyedra.AAC.1
MGLTVQTHEHLEGFGARGHFARMLCANDFLVVVSASAPCPASASIYVWDYIDAVQTWIRAQP